MYKDAFAPFDKMIPIFRSKASDAIFDKDTEWHAHGSYKKCIGVPRVNPHGGGVFFFSYPPKFAILRKKNTPLEFRFVWQVK